VVVLGTAVWSDYDGDTIYGDYTVDEETGAVTALASYLPGIGQVDEATGAVYYDHADHLGSVRVVTTCGVGAGDCVPGEAGMVVERIVHTAFGEPGTRMGIALTPTRYLYAGAWGYESDLGAAHAGGSPDDDALPYQHLGYRWYDPSTGRFLQRDPIGIVGGWNTYEYVSSEPLRALDPWGLSDPFEDIDAAIDWAGTTGANCVSNLVVEPPQIQIPSDFSKPPGSGWVWRGTGPAGSEEGSWVKEGTKERLHKHFRKSCHGPHYDYRDAHKRRWRIYPDGRIELAKTKANKI